MELALELQRPAELRFGAGRQRQPRVGLAERGADAGLGLFLAREGAGVELAGGDVEHLLDRHLGGSVGAPRVDRPEHRLEELADGGGLALAGLGGGAEAIRLGPRRHGRVALPRRADHAQRGADDAEHQQHDQRRDGGDLALVRAEGAAEALGGGGVVGGNDRLVLGPPPHGRGSHGAVAGMEGAAVDDSRANGFVPGAAGRLVGRRSVLV
jgi:hypothetical protein